MQIQCKEESKTIYTFHSREFLGTSGSQQGTPEVHWYNVFQVCGMTDKQQALLLLNGSLFFSGQKMFVVELSLEKEGIDLLAFCVVPEIIIAMPTSYRLCSKATDTHLFCLYCIL